MNVRCVVVRWMVAGALAASAGAAAAEVRFPRGVTVAASPSVVMNGVDAVTQVDIPKQWVDDFPAFVNASGGGKGWIVAKSAQPCLTAEEASQAALMEAHRRLIGRVEAQVGRSPDGSALVWLTRRISQELNTGELVVDRSVSRVHRPYADVWSEAILVDASSQRLAPIVRDYAAWQRERDAGRRGTFASVAGMSVAVLLIYAGLNAFTKGYFRGRLRAGAALLLAAGAVAIMRAL